MTPSHSFSIMNTITSISLKLILSTVMLTLMNKGDINVGYETADPNSEEIKATANKLLKKLNGDSNSNYKLKINHILSAKTQVVAGKNTFLRLEICLDSGTYTSVSERRTTRRMMITGGIREVDPTSDRIKSVASNLVAKLNAESGSDCKQKVSQLLQASVQVVAGTLYRIKMETCSENCVYTNECQICSAKVWVKEWENNFFEVQEFNCDKKPTVIIKANEFKECKLCVATVYERPWPLSSPAFVVTAFNCI